MLTIKSKCRTDKGVSPIIATLLLIVIAVAAAVVTYTFVMGFVGTSSQNTGPSGQLTYDTYSVTGDATNSNFTVYVRNTGGKSVTLSTVYVDGVSYTYATGNTSVPQTAYSWAFTVSGATQVLDVAQVGTLYVNSSGLNPAQWHTVKIVCIDGTALEFSVKK